MTDLEYFQYLQGRSQLGRIYRRFWLYPHICKYLTGTTLDVGCGIGDLLQYRPNTTGVDINAEAVRWCQQQGLNVKIMEKDSLPFSGQIFDSVNLDNVLEHLENPATLLNEIYRVLVDNGIVVIGVPGKRGFTKDSDHKVFYSKKQLVAIVKGYGFEIQQFWAMPFEWAWLDEKMSQYCLYGVFRRIKKNG